jgi:hypothetical protein
LRLAPSLSPSKERLLHFTVPDRHHWNGASIYVSFCILIFPLYSVQNVVLQHYSTQGSQTYRASVHHPLVEIITCCSLILSLRHCQLLHPDSYCMSPRCSQVHTLIVLLLFLVTKTWPSYVLLWSFFGQVAHFISIYTKKISIKIIITCHLNTDDLNITSLKQWSMYLGIFSLAFFICNSWWHSCFYQLLCHSYKCMYPICIFQ